MNTNKYAQISLIAAKYVNNGICPVEAWEKASCEIYEKGSFSQKKSCPKHTFLSLYDQSAQSKNADYAREALQYLREHTSITTTPKELWNIILKGEIKTYNSQMDIVIALYQEGFVK